MKSYVELKRELAYEKYKNRVLEEIIIKYEKFIVQHNKEMINMMGDYQKEVIKND